MQIHFKKYQGAGNDFVMIDNRLGSISLTKEQIAFLCDRRFGIGADGLILLEADEESDFRMVYFNSDGSESTMCGNGGRCVMAFAFDLGVVANSSTFKAIDGLHHADKSAEIVTLGMIDPQDITARGNDFFINTGSPHHVRFVNDVQSVDVEKEGKAIRYGIYGETGANINFVQIQGQELLVRTYERGVEGETLACGTGVTAAAIIAHYSGRLNATSIPIQAQGGDLSVRFELNNGHYTNVLLIGPAKFVFEGTIEI